jgi:hypothetical protein
MELKMVQAVEARVSQFCFLKAANLRKQTPNTKAIKKYGTNIISECQSILALTNDPYCKERLSLIIHNTTNLMAVTFDSSNKSSSESKDLIIEACRELQSNLLSLPTTISTPTDLATVNYRIALTCLYILLLSVALTIGAAFGAWYFGFLTAAYFTDTLAIALASIGIPGVCVGAFSFSVYSVQKNPVEEHLNKLGENIDFFCNEIVQDETENEINHTKQV